MSITLILLTEQEDADKQTTTNLLADTFTALTHRSNKNRFPLNRLTTNFTTTHT
jgi:hypothetical protein